MPKINHCEHYRKVIYIRRILHLICRRISQFIRGRRGRIVVGIMTTYEINA
jgi:hypothetical protein